jgi:hypothetical protein
MSWQDQFVFKKFTINGKHIECYMYKDKSVKTLPANLPMPPTDMFYRMFSGCYQLQNIVILSSLFVNKFFVDCSNSFFVIFFIYRDNDIKLA